MNREQIDIMVHTMELSDTMFLGLNYLDEKMEAGQFDTTFEVMGSVLCGMDSIKRALPGVINSLPVTELGHSTIELRDLFETVRENYLAGESVKVHTTLKEHLIPAFERWQSQVYEHFKPYTGH